jgi:hypothetical protein
MEVNKLESKEVLIILFGLPVMITLIVLASIGVGHVVTTRSDRPTNVTVAAATPKIEVNVPQQPAPKIQVSATVPNVDVNVPQALPPTINVTTPPAVVTVLERGDRSQAKLVSTDTVEKTIPVTANPDTSTNDNKAVKPAEKKPADTPPNFTPESGTPAPSTEPSKNNSEKTSDAPTDAGGVAQKLNTVRDEDLTLETLYEYAEKYIESYCAKKNLDVAAESTKWIKKWNQSVEQSIRDNTDSDEQSYINRVTITKRECFDIEKATPEKIVEGCRIMLRYRDGQFAWLKAMRDAVTNESLKKTLVFLSAGAR